VTTERKSVPDVLAQAIAGFRSVVWTVAGFSAIVNLLMLAPSLYMLQVYDRVLPSRNGTTLAMLTVLVVGVLLLTGALELLRSLVAIRVGARLDVQAGPRVYDAAFERSLRDPGSQPAQALHDLATVRQFLSGNGLFAFFDAPWFPVYLLVIFLFDWRLGVFALAGTIVLTALAWVNGAVSRRPLAEANRLALASQQQVNNALRNAEAIEAMGMLPSLRRRWQATQSACIALQSEASDKAGVVGALSKFTRTAMQSLVLAFGAVLVLQDHITPGMMIVASILMGRVLSPVDQLIGTWKGFSSARSAYRRLEELLRAHPPREPGMPLPAPQGRLELEAVTAGAPGAAAPSLHGASVALASGDVLGIIGPSGAGKSTLARVMIGVWPTTEGSVRLDGADLSARDRAAVGPHLGYLPQDVELFAGTVSENIARFGDVDAEKVVEAARRAGVHEMILHLPQGYDTPLGAGGAGLSGGQRQRIGLARALYGHPRLVVLDEPSANLDEQGERALVAAIEGLRARGATVVLVTHQTGVLACTTKLLALVDGRVRVVGPTAEVMAQFSRPVAPARAAAAGRPSAVAPLRAQQATGGTR
jgi:ATP-binding cassette subfamily C exporter for protease/lipase